jgi:outer membrane protein assembly factor BamB
MRKKLFYISMILLGTVLLSACTGAIRGSSWPGLSAEGDVAYLASGGFVYAVNLKDGKEIWHYPSSAGGTKLVFYATPVVTEDGLVIVGSAGTEHDLIAIDPADIDPETNSPVEAWTFTDAEDHWVASPLIVGDKLFAPNADGNLYILDLSDGRSQKQAVAVVELTGRCGGC